MSTNPALPRTPAFRLDGRRALVTGAGRGIGLAIAAALSDAGAHTVLAARSHGEIEAGAAAIRAAGGAAEAMLLDVSDPQAAAAAIGSVPAFDILVNNAGTNRPKSFVDVGVEDFDAVFDLNVRAAFFVAQVVARGQIAAGLRGSIIHMSSQMGHVGAPGGASTAPASMLSRA